MGTGVIMIRKDVFEQIEKPWFTVAYNKDTGEELGEDYWFCQRCREAGIPIMVDHDLSKAVYHMGNYNYGVKDYE